ncbi:parasitic phase-specific protein PSP-1 [Microdochium trichocladiopsis]|uniref:Parasitic phase-specific protein PSP-1 n=1 Tax=Microdochium trichocladiopsis TaxID=1682393 RepID=A0A9P8YK22_9PEZI|nr:parasitic phase-specific protein PSP-1 [Microdochium trichocladiopsis]KAH7041328.1 parasitic phase-specific protein PSP-1 [Microdochium trichocladiopsis]
MDHPTLIPFGPKSNCNLDVCPLEWTIFKYRPSMAASISFIALYSLLMCFHIYLGFRWRSWWFTICVALGCVEEILGYAGRIILYHNPFNFAGFMLQIVCIGSAPVFYTAAIYVTISMVVESLDVSLSRLPPKMYYAIFISCDVIALVFQAVGGVLSTTSSGQSTIAVPLSLAGLIFQVVITFIFSVLFADYLIRYFRAHKRQSPSSVNTNNSNENGSSPAARDRPDLKRLKIFTGFMAAAILLILARCIYRVEELREGYTGKMMTNEPLFIALEGVLIVLAVSCLLVGNPGFVFIAPEKGLKATLRGNGQQTDGAGVETGSSSDASAEKVQV